MIMANRVSSGNSKWTVHPSHGLGKTLLDLPQEVLRQICLFSALPKTFHQNSGKSLCVLSVLRSTCRSLRQLVTSEKEYWRVISVHGLRTPEEFTFEPDQEKIKRREEAFLRFIRGLDCKEFIESVEFPRQDFVRPYTMYQALDLLPNVKNISLQKFDNVRGWIPYCRRDTR